MNNCPPGFEQPCFDSNDWEEDLYQSWYSYYVNTLGLSRSLLKSRVNDEKSGKLAKKTINTLISNGISIKDKRILDVGCGHGTLVNELAKTGANVIGIEPSVGWSRIASRRLNEIKPTGNAFIISGDATKLPFNDGFFSLIISMQVIEHVKNYKLLIKEISRVLTPDGIILVSCDNYLSFFEPHYKVFWLPLLPKTIGTKYLQLIRRNPEFLQNNIHYVTYPMLILYFLKANLWSIYWPKKLMKLPFCIKYLLIIFISPHKLFRHNFFHIFSRCNNH